MIPLLVCNAAAPATAPCPLCDAPVTTAAGLQLVTADALRPVCPACGKKHAPALAGLLALADEARRIGRIGRHLVVPPYAALLDLARAADTFAAHLTPPAREAG